MVDIPPDIAHTVLQLGKSTISARLAPVITTQGEFLGIVTIFRDITREVEADRAKNEFVSTVSHELRTPMTAIKGYTDLIISGMVGEINEDQLRFLTVIKNNTDRLTALVDDLLDIARIETGRLRFEPESVRLGDIVKNVVDALASRAESKSHTLTLRIAVGLPEIMADPHRLNQVFTNLVNNAINYTPDGGVINVEVYFVGGAIRVDVEDTGIGIATEDLPKIFERFYRVDHPLVHENPGTGLGLPIVKMFVEMHGGRVWVDSEMGNGSRFTVLLPVPTARPEEGMGLLSSHMVVRPYGHQVLVAADDPDVAGLVKLQLEEAGYGVMVVRRGVRVLELARRWCPDLILLDISLPDMDGRAVLEALKSEPQTTEIPVVMLTRVADDRTAFELRAAGYLTKPIDSQELLDVARTALARRRRILLVEDDLDTIEMMRLALRRLGYAVDIAANGYEALSLARRWRPEAIVLDLRLPGMDGYEALAHLKRSLNTQDIPIIVISAHAADPEREGKRLRTLGANSFLVKPFSVDQLIYEIDLVTGPMRSAQGEDDADSRK
jgi:signal transduction histidine kinase/CheY-like chemotaxis protein